MAASGLRMRAPEEESRLDRHVYPPQHSGAGWGVREIWTGCQGDEAFMLRARKVFDSYDTQGLGRLDRGSVKLAWMALLGHKPSRCELADMLEQERGRVGGDVRDGDDEDSGIQHVGWAKFVQAAARRRGGTDGTNEVRQAFKAFDRRCLGFLTLADVKDTFREVAPHVPERTVEAIFFEFDDDHDGRVNFAQFERLWLRGL